MRNIPSSLPWKTAWITGAGRGIGESVAKLLCHYGLTVYASARNSSELNNLKNSCCNELGLIVPIPMDITDPRQIDDMMLSWDQGHGVPDLVILNAGTHDPFPAHEFSAERCSKLLRTNLQGTINCIDPVLKRFIKRNSGQLAVMASVAGYRGLPTAAAYGASKAALINLCEALRLDLKGTDIKLQVINPGFVRTPLTDKNDFKMPALMEPEEAAVEILNGLLGRRFEICFPKRFVYLLKFLRLLPYSWYFGLLEKSVKVEPETEAVDKHG
ncbi:MAG: SDR family NAD(P)-dependent oxidoreductase [Neptuniibacter sp.]|nr:SDR family NAD(P)-dependent oxidoreductase [Neptuniibacter sp.]